MAMVDYGALTIVDGKLINEGQFFMKTSDTGYMLKEAILLTGDTIPIEDEFFAYFGDKDLFLCFYKTCIYIIQNGVVVETFYKSNFASEEFFIGKHKIKISHLDKNKYEMESFLDELPTWKKYMDERYIKPKNMSDKEFYKRVGEIYKDYRKLIINSKKYKKKPIKDYYNRYVAEWVYKNKEYKVIFGYGIDSDKDCYIRISSDKRNPYEFTKTEKEYINKVFGLV